MAKIIRRLVDNLYLWSAICVCRSRLLRFKAGMRYAMAARFYFEFSGDQALDIAGWPWSYKVACKQPNTDVVEHTGMPK
jgi:hypothetical protein